MYKWSVRKLKLDMKNLNENTNQNKHRNSCNSDQFENESVAKGLVVTSCDEGNANKPYKKNYEIISRDKKLTKNYRGKANSFANEAFLEQHSIYEFSKNLRFLLKISFLNIGQLVEYRCYELSS